ncbi:MAG: hypothetical protein M3041_00595 [Acidobacteriota bacterium]|nr:hypothetical protein [Acidobacteriota bacterium]
MGERTDNGPVLGSGWMQTFSLFILIVGSVALFATFKDSDLRQYRQIGFIAFAVGLLPAAFVAYRFWRLRQVLGIADLKFDDRVPLGFSGTATYFRPKRGAEVRSVEVRLQCEEEIVRGGGKNKTRVTKIVHDEVLTATVTPMMERLEVRIPVRIPASGPASFYCSTAETKWWIRLRLKMSGCPNTASSFQIEVVPGLAHL